jgi:glyoxylase-like metal-dependent hydrolase (beta-lactamase superfamily II)
MLLLAPLALLLAATPVTYDYCTDAGPMRLTFDGRKVTGTYSITVKDPADHGTIEGTLDGTPTGGLLTGKWTEAKSGGQIFIAFRGTAFSSWFNSRSPESWSWEWLGHHAAVADAAARAQSRIFHCAENGEAASQQRARQVLDRLVTKFGTVRSARIVEQITRVDFDESPKPAPPLSRSTTTDTTLIDFEQQRLWSEQDQHYANYHPHFIRVVDGTGGWFGDFNGLRAARSATASFANNAALFDKLPQRYYAGIAEGRASTLRWRGEHIENGRLRDAISFLDRDDRHVTLFVDRETGLPERHEILYTDCRRGDAPEVQTFGPWRSTGGTFVPTTRTIRQFGEIASEVRYETFDVNPSLDPGSFALPSSFTVVTAGSQRLVPYSVTKLADGVHLVERAANGTNVLVVEFADHLMIVEAPEARAYSRASERTLDAVRRAIPGKPVRYLTFTHSHLDHGCGVRAYIAAGATIVTTPGNRAYVDELAKAPYRRVADALALSRRTPVVELIRDKKHRITDGVTTVELYDIGPYWHSDEELIVYLPRQKILYEGDLFTSGTSNEIGPAQPSGELLLRRIEELGLDVETVVGSHGIARPMADLRKAVALRAQLK